MVKRTNQFVDLEARVDDGEDSEASCDVEDAMERDVEDMFVDDSYSEDTVSMRARMISKEPDESRRNFEEYMDELLISAKANSRFEQLGTYIDMTRMFQLSENDFPLWRIQCRHGLEEIAILSVMQTSRERHEIRSAFSNGTVRGSIYVESRMNPETIELLRMTPGIMAGRSGVIRRVVEIGDYVKTLTTERIDTNFKEGDWVRVRRGVYEGDVGIIDSVQSWGVVLLLPPRLSLEDTHTGDRKRKLSAVRAEPRLFRPEETQPQSVTKLREVRSSTYRRGNMIFEYGLLSKEYNFASIDKKAYRISHTAFRLFEMSGHPRVTESPTLCPSEWCIQDGDHIIHSVSRERGRIVNVYTDRAEAEFEDGGIRVIWWRHVQKRFFIGEAVSAIGIADGGIDSWVVSCTGDLATVVSGKRTTGAANKLEYTETEVMVNTLKRGTMLSGDATNAPENSLSRARAPHPWIGIHVLICRQGHPRKGDTGRILDILPPRPGRVDPIIRIQLTSYNPSEPYREITVEYDDIVEESKLKSLHKTDVRTLGSVGKTSACDLPTGGQTPMPTGDSSTPAWNPRHDIDDWDALQVRESLPVQAVPSNRHILINPIFAGVKLNVVIEGRKNYVTVNVDLSNGSGCLREISYHTSKQVPEDKAKPKHPNPTHDNGLLVIIKGEHIGKYARRVHHQHIKEGMTLVKVAIVEVTEGSVDRDTGKILEMDTGDLCAVEESEKQKKLNKKPMEEMCHRLKKAPLS